MVGAVPVFSVQLQLAAGETAHGGLVLVLQGASCCQIPASKLMLILHCERAGGMRLRMSDQLQDSWGSRNAFMSALTRCT